MEVFLALSSSSCLSPLYSASESSCIMTQLHKELETAQISHCQLRERHISFTLGQRFDGLNSPMTRVNAPNHGIKEIQQQLTAPFYNAVVLYARSELEACLPDSTYAMC